MISIFESISFTLKEIGKLEVNQRGGGLFATRMHQ